MNYKLWNREESINGVEASYFLNKNPFKSESGDIILIYNGDKVSQVECKRILASIYGIDINLSLDDFMTAYNEKLNAVSEEVAENEVPQLES